MSVPAPAPAPAKGRRVRPRRTSSLPIVNAARFCLRSQGAVRACLRRRVTADPQTFLRHSLGLQNRLETPGLWGHFRLKAGNASRDKASRPHGFIMIHRREMNRKRHGHIYLYEMTRQHFTTTQQDFLFVCLFPEAATRGAQRELIPKVRVRVTHRGRDPGGIQWLSRTLSAVCCSLRSPIKRQTRDTRALSDQQQ